MRSTMATKAKPTKKGKANPKEMAKQAAKHGMGYKAC
jgi:hypothetical protein